MPCKTLRFCTVIAWVIVFSVRTDAIYRYPTMNDHAAGMADLPSAVRNTLPAQTLPACGIVDGIQYPVDTIESVTIADGYDDFAIYRARWGGNHVGLDVAFRRQGSPVYAAARGRVTLANITEWGEEGGVVVIAHDFPDHSRYYTVYGHVEETDEYRLPQVGDCVEMGEIIAAVGWPASSAPHMHYEVRNFLPDEGGPGYIDSNPLEQGWYHPIDFTMLWRLRLSPYLLDYVTFDQTPTLPPAMLDNGTVAIASGKTVWVYAPPETALWRVNMDEFINGLYALPGSRVMVRSRSGQTAVISGGRYQALWKIEGADRPFVMLGETAVFVTEGGGLSAYTVTGDPLWSVEMPDQNGTVLYSEANGSTMAMIVDLNARYIWRVVDASGNLLHDVTFQTRPVAAPVADGSWMLLVDSTLRRVHAADNHVIATVDVSPRRTARLVADVVGNTYLFVGDIDNTLIAWDSLGGQRWQVKYPALTAILLPPLLRVDAGCLLYGLDGDGRLSIFNTMDGSLVNQVNLYAGGSQSGQPGARLLDIDPAVGKIILGAGFLSLVTLDANALAADALSSCWLG